ncbi:PREDICTED: uncharacterized protein LOC104590427 isoform X1 [Nelumbo nucifera]|uniref:Uncharacterized protein LOC104590427 isoform X1 n=1 Tax=Nelumbo nucifera TaxID=4432 RepID=A0A1U7Z532_NELNU|nr:PREDICTED: uncharacterized protein LOC104590427 isoform X1 [Nelumbo nucifera]
MRARLIVFPIKGRNWCFSRSIDTSVSELGYSRTSPTLKDLCKEISSNGKSMNENAELVVDFVSDKMNRAWIGLEKAPEGTFKKKIYGLGLHLLARVKPSEIFLKSISKEVTEVEVTFPKSLNSRLVRRRLRHTALRGTIIHRKYFYGSVSLLPFTMAFTVLPLPNIPFFWILFRSYSHWRALKGSERLLLLVSDFSKALKLDASNENGKEIASDDHGINDSSIPSLVLNPCEELGKLLGQGAGYGVSRRVITDICKAYHLDTKEVLKYHNSV